MDKFVRPSSASRWMVCPASRDLTTIFNEDELEVSKDSPAAREGSFFHAMVEAALKGTDSQQVLKDFSELEWSEEQGARLREFVAYAQKLQKESYTLYSELGVALPAVDGFRGTVDLLAYKQGSIKVVDIKYGQMVVPVKGNKQLLTYLTLALHNRIITEPIDSVTDIELVIYQPKSDGFTTWKPTAREVAAFKDELISTLKADPDPTTKSGGHCFFCPAKLICESQELLTKVSKVLEVQKKKGDKPEARLKKDRVAKPELSAITLGKLLSTLQEASKLYDAYKDLATSRLESGKKVTGWKLEDGLGNTRWSDAAVASLTGRQELFKNVLITTTEARKFLNEEEQEKYLVRPHVKKLVQEESK